MDPFILNVILAAEMAVTKENAALRSLNRMSDKKRKLKGQIPTKIRENAGEESSQLFKAAKKNFSRISTEWLVDAAAWVVVPFFVAQLLLVFTYLMTLALASSLGPKHLAAFGLYVSLPALKSMTIQRKFSFKMGDPCRTEVILSVVTQPSNIILIGLGLRAGLALRDRQVAEAGPRLKIAFLGSLAIGCICTVLTTAARFPLFHIIHLPREVAEVETRYFIIRTCTLPLECLFVTVISMLYASGKPYQMAFGITVQCFIKIIWSSVGVLAFFGDLFYLGLGFLVAFVFTIFGAMVFILRPSRGRYAILLTCEWRTTGRLIKKSTVLKIMNAIVAQLGMYAKGSLISCRCVSSPTKHHRFVLFCLCAHAGTAQLATITVLLYMMRSVSSATGSVPHILAYLLLDLLRPRSYRPSLYKGGVIFLSVATLFLGVIALFVVLFGRSVIINALTTSEDVARLLDSSWWLLFMAVFIVSLSVVTRAIMLSRRHYATLLVSTAISLLLCELPWVIFAQVEGKDIRFLGLVLILPWAISSVGCFIRVFLMQAPPHLVPSSNEEDLVVIDETEHYEVEHDDSGLVAGEQEHEIEMAAEQMIAERIQEYLAQKEAAAGITVREEVEAC